MGYGYQTRIAYHEIDPHRKLTLSGLINRFQDCGGFHGDDCGYSNKQLADMGLAWILASWQIVITEMPELSERVWLETFPYKYRYCMANRYFRLSSTEGKEFVRADSVWILMNMKQYAPVRIPQEMADAYGRDGAEDIFKGYDFGGRKIEKDDSFKPLDEICVAKYMIDTNYHVNNEQYVRIAQAYLPEGFEWNTFRGEYTKQARLGDKMIPELAADGNVCRIALSDENGDPYFLGEWSKKDTQI